MLRSPDKFRRHCNLDDLHSVRRLPRPDRRARIGTSGRRVDRGRRLVHAAVRRRAARIGRQLDAVVPDRPAYLMNTDTHGGVGQHEGARARRGITAHTPDPWDGYFVRDADG